uniref:No apical meristem-associated C-terminal domain-containing protein n=2 Tax=Brassica oleracea TaxID=3712 RepID=A0A0D3CUH6_BRAOL|nr:unnamed protein product [Brassica oleracea]
MATWRDSIGERIGVVAKHRLLSLFLLYLFLLSSPATKWRFLFFSVALLNQRRVSRWLMSTTENDVPSNGCSHRPRETGRYLSWLVSETKQNGSFDTEASNFDGDTAVERRERHKWIPEDDILLISSWLNTSKDVMVGNEQRSDAFWSRIAAYFDASRESEATGAATKEKRSGQNDNDVLKLAHQIFYHNHHKKFTLEHAWKELRNDQKWCNLATAKHLSSKKRKSTENKCPPGVKAANASSKKKVAEENSLNGFQSMWTIKQQDLLIKERLSKMSLLDSLLGKKEPLAEHEEALKKKLIDDLISS